MVGSDLFGDESLNVTSTDTFSVKARTVLVDSVRVYNEDNVSRSTFLVGVTDDPIFGKTTASLVADVHYGVDLLTGQLFKPGYEEGDVLDSLILVLEIDSVGFYGDDNATFDFEVFQLAESINQLDEIYSNREISFDPESIGTKENVFISTDSVSVYYPSLGTTRRELSQIRIPLGEEIGNLLFEDLRDIETNAEFIQEFFGVRVEATPSTNNTMFGVNIASTSFNSRIQSFYSRADTTLLFEYPLNDLTTNLSLGRKLSALERDISSASISQFLGDAALGDSLLFVQSLLGTDVELDFSSIFNIEDFLINQAILELTVAVLPGDNLELNPPIDQLILSSRGDDGQLDLLDEINEGLIFNQLEVYFGGAVDQAIVNDVTLYRYEMNITRSLIEISNGNLPSKLFLTPLLRNERANRSVIYGPGHSDYPLKLTLSVTSP